jgi:GH24 family phage-related lysozyme (muramidase)
MKLSKQGAMELIGHEAIVQTRYRDSKNIWTIGVGHTRAAGEPDPATYTETMPLNEVFKLFQRDMQNRRCERRAQGASVANRIRCAGVVPFQYRRHQQSEPREIDQRRRQGESRQAISELEEAPGGPAGARRSRSSSPQASIPTAARRSSSPPIRTASCSGRKPRSSTSPRNSTRRDVPRLNSTPRRAAALVEPDAVVRCHLGPL